MQAIKDILLQFKNIKTPNQKVEEEVKKAIKKVLNLSQDCFEVKFRNPNLSIKCFNPILKSEIFIKKEKIIKEIQKRLDKNQDLKIFTI